MASIHELFDRDLQHVVEALVFAAEIPVTSRRVAEVYTDVTGREPPGAGHVADVVKRLNDAYKTNGRVFRIEAWGGGWRMATVATAAPFLKSFFARERERTLSRTLMETLAIVAYRQPVTKPEIDFVRGIDSGYALTKLMEKGLIDVRGRSNSLGRPLIYGTTQFFLDQFGLNTLADLPVLREIEDILDDPAFSRERAELLQLQREETGTFRENGEGDEEHGGAVESHRQ